MAGDDDRVVGIRQAAARGSSARCHRATCRRGPTCRLRPRTTCRRRGASSAPAVVQRERNATRRVPGRMQHLQRGRPAATTRPSSQVAVERGDVRCGQPEPARLFGERSYSGRSPGVAGRARRCLAQRGERADVVEVGVCVDERRRPHAESVEASENPFGLVAAVDDDGLPAVEIGHDRADAPQRTDGEVFDVDGAHERACRSRGTRRRSSPAASPPAPRIPRPPRRRSCASLPLLLDTCSRDTPGALDDRASPCRAGRRGTPANGRLRRAMRRRARDSCCSTASMLTQNRRARAMSGCERPGRFTQTSTCGGSTETLMNGVRREALSARRRGRSSRRDPRGKAPHGGVKALAVCRAAHAIRGADPVPSPSGTIVASRSGCDEEDRRLNARIARVLSSSSSRGGSADRPLHRRLSTIDEPRRLSIGTASAR